MFMVTVRELSGAEDAGSVSCQRSVLLVGDDAEVIDDAPIDERVRG